MEKELRIITSLLPDLPPETRKRLILAIKICDIFQTQLERHGEVAFANVHSILRDKEKRGIAYKVAEMMDMKLVSRKKNPESKREGKAWVQK